MRHSSLLPRCDQLLQRAFVHLRRMTGFTGVADIAVFDRPCNFTIVTGAAVFSVNDFQHIDLITTGFHLEAEIGMANLATEPNTVEPMRKNNRAHAGIV